MDFSIKESGMVEVLKVLKQLPEFDRLMDDGYYFDKIEGKDHLLLITYVNHQAVGCKVGYDKFNDGSFYSWLGGVIPSQRGKGYAKAMADYQEQWAQKKGYSKLKFKTLNRHKSMLIFSIKNGFEIYNVKEKDELENYRIELIKRLR